MSHIRLSYLQVLEFIQSHLSQLKKHIGHATTQTELPILDEDGLIPKVPIAILDSCMVKQNNVIVPEVLVELHSIICYRGIIHKSTRSFSRF